MGSFAFICQLRGGAHEGHFGVFLGLKCKAGCKDAHPCFGSSIHAFSEPSEGAWMEQLKKNNSNDLTSMPHPGLGAWSSRGETCSCLYGALVERADRDRRVDRVAPNESSGAQLRAELWPETCFGPYGALVERADRSSRRSRGTEREFCSSSGSRVMARNVFLSGCASKKSRPLPWFLRSFG